MKIFVDSAISAVSAESTCSKIGPSEVVLCLIFFCPLLFSSKGDRTWTLISEYELAKLILCLDVLHKI